MSLTINEKTFGIDISDGALRLVKLKQRGKKIFLVSYNEILIPPEIMKNGEIQKEGELISLFNKLIKSAKGNKINNKNIVAVLPEAKTFIKVIKVDSPEKKEDLPQLINKEIKKHIPLSLDEIYLDWQITEKNQETTKLVVGIAPKNIVDSYLLILEKSGLNPYVLEIEAAAIARSLIPENDKKAKIIIDFGAIRTGLIIYDHQTIQFTVSLPLSGNKITETIVQILGLDYAKAEKAKIVCGLDQNKCEGALLKILLKSIDDLVSQIKKIIAFYKSNFPEGAEISEIILCGGGANFLNIEKVLSEKIGLPVKIGNPLLKINQTKKINIPKNKTLSYTTAIGLALRDFQKK